MGPTVPESVGTAVKSRLEAENCQADLFQAAAKVILCFLFIN